jgi:translocator protein
MKKGVRKKKKIDWGLLGLSFVSVFFIASIGSLFTTPNVNSLWYNLIKPTITPPNFVFPIVWSLLFFLIAVSLYLALTSTKDKLIRKKIGIVFGINLLLNALWSFLFFELRNPAFAFYEIILFEISIFAIMAVLWKVNKISVWLIVPYSLWVGFASILNYLIAFG